MKKRLTVAALVLLVSMAVILPILARDIHALLSGNTGLLSVSPLAGWAAVLQISQVGKLYLLLSGALALLILWAMVSSSSLKYRSDMQRITPEISTPCADGQGQYGTARWLSKNKYDKCFHAQSLADLDGLEELLEAGKRDKEEIDGKR